MNVDELIAPGLSIWSVRMKLDEQRTKESGRIE